MNFYSQFVGIGLKKIENSFNTFKDINESSLKFYAYKAYFNDTFSGSDMYGQSIKSRTEALKDILSCLGDLSLYGDRICFVREGLIKQIIKYHPKLRNENFSLAKAVFNCLNIKYSFEKSSPYAQKFFYIFRHIHESGINRVLEPEWNKKVVKQVEEQNDGPNFFLISLIFILIFGYTVSMYSIFFY